MFRRTGSLLAACDSSLLCTSSATPKCTSNSPRRLRIANEDNARKGNRGPRGRWIAAGGALTFTVGSAFLFGLSRVRSALAQSSEAAEKSPVSDRTEEEGKVKIELRSDLPTFRMDEIRNHGKDADTIWVTFQQGVYDITDFVHGHPGGKKILMAAGGRIDPFWNIYQQHQTPEVLEILEDLRIGNLDSRDVTVDDFKEDEGPYVNEPRRQTAAFLVNSRKPFNAESSPDLLIDHFITPNDLFFVRNHLPVPEVDEDVHRLTVEGVGIKRPLSLSVNDLKEKFPEVYITSVVQCAGNRRKDMADFKKVQGLSWKGTAIGNAKWTGVRLRDVLISAGVDQNDKRIKHVQFLGADHDTEGNHYGGSITFEKAMSDEVIIAYSMNDEKLSRDHGFPLRLIAPGIVGARQVKWLSEIKLSDEESPTHWQRNDYKVLPPTVGLNDAQPFHLVPSIQEAPVQSAFCLPANLCTVHRADGEIDVAGYAWSGGGKGIVRVEISADGGQTWQSAQLEQDPEQDHYHMWAWTLFRATVKIPDGADQLDLVCKATDRSNNTQPETANAIWNVRGLLHNAWHHVRVNVRD